MSAALLVLVSFLVASVAGDPPKPSPSGSFTATGEVEVHSAEGTSIGGTFTIARDEKGSMGFEEINYGNSNQVSKMLQRYDKNITYYVRGTKGGEHCIEEESKGQLAGFWDWLKPSFYEGYRTFRHVDLDLWGYTLADIRYEAAFNQNETTTPVLFNRFSAEYSVGFTIFKYTAGTPDPSIFDPPKECSPGSPTKTQ